MKIYTILIGQEIDGVRHEEYNWTCDSDKELNECIEFIKEGIDADDWIDFNRDDGPMYIKVITVYLRSEEDNFETIYHYEPSKLIKEQD